MEIKEVEVILNKYVNQMLNIIIDNKYTLKMNNRESMREERLESISRLVERYLNIGIKAPK